MTLEPSLQSPGLQFLHVPFLLSEMFQDKSPSELDAQHRQGVLNTSFQVRRHPQLLFKNKENINIVETHPVFRRSPVQQAASMNHDRPCGAVNLVQLSAMASIRQLVMAAKHGLCLGRVEEDVSSATALVSAAAHLVPPTVYSLDSWPLLCVMFSETKRPCKVFGEP